MTRQPGSRLDAGLERQLDAYLASARANVPPRWREKLVSWSAYAAAAGSALAFTTAAEAGIIYSGIQNVSASLLTSKFGIKPSATARVPGGPNATLDLEFNRFTTAKGFIDRTGAARLLNNNFPVQFLGGPAPFRSLSQLRLGAVISRGLSAGGRTFGGNAVLYRHKLFASSTSKGGIVVKNITKGQWKSNATGFAAFRIAAGTSNGQNAYDYGWIRLKWTAVANPGFPTKLTEIDWAYNSTANQAIEAGATSSTPEPSSLTLGLLAMGAAGVMACRKRRPDDANRTTPLSATL